MKLSFLTKINGLLFTLAMGMMLSVAGGLDLLASGLFILLLMVASLFAFAPEGSLMATAVRPRRRRRRVMPQQKAGIPGLVTAQQKIAHVARVMGNAGVKKQQGTTRIIYDSILLSGQTEFRFFEDAASKTAPFTNLFGQGFQLGVGETLAVERCFFVVANIIAATGEVVSFDSLSGTGLPNIELGTLKVTIANQTVIKPIPLTSFDARFNKNAASTEYSNFEFDTMITIQSLLEFAFEVRTSFGTTVADTYLMCFVEGVGSIINPKVNQ